jgi:hypothetical protein
MRFSKKDVVSTGSRGKRSMRKGSRFGGLDGDWKGFCHYMNKKLRLNKNKIEPDEL